MRAREAGAALLGALLNCAPAMAADRTPEDCAQLTDDGGRLACYDALFRREPYGAARAGTPAAEAPASSPPTIATAPRVAPEPPSLMSKFWELSRTEKRGTFVVRTYLPNFFLPLHYSSDIGVPASPTHPASGTTNRNRHAEVKLQISLRAKIAQSVFLPDADLWFGYTQRSFWQLWTPSQSSPFRSTDYEPELIYVVPIPESLSVLPGGWRWKMGQVGLAHQSNGQTDPLSRSWNRVYVGAGLERGEVSLLFRAHRRLPENGTDDNPDLTHYIGRQELTASWLPGLATASLTWRTNLTSWRRGSLQLDWTYPVNRDQPEGLRYHVQVFSGYGESLLDYNHRQNSIGLGLTLFHF